MIGTFRRVAAAVAHDTAEDGLRPEAGLRDDESLLDFLRGEAVPGAAAQAAARYAAYADEGRLSPGTPGDIVVRAATAARLLVEARRAPRGSRERIGAWSDALAVGAYGPADAGMTEAARAAVQSRMDWMEHNLDGCDWCCGGGDEEIATLCQREVALDRWVAAARHGRPLFPLDTAPPPAG